MGAWADIASKFNEHSNSLYHGSKNTLIALKSVQNLLENAYPQMIFLLGDEGSGKSYMLNHIKKLYEKERFCFTLDNAPQTKEKFLHLLLKARGVESKSSNVEDLTTEVVEAYSNLEHIIMLDMSLDLALLEVVRSFNELRLFSFLITMDRKKGEELLLTPHFYATAHQIVYLKPLDKSEYISFIEKVLNGTNIKLSKDMINVCWSYTNGNYKDLKNLFKELFLILDHGINAPKKEISYINSNTLKMAAMKSGLLKCEGQSYDELYKEAKRDPKRTKYLGSIALICSIGFVFGYLLKDMQNQNEIKQILKDVLQKDRRVVYVEPSNEPIKQELPKVESKEEFVSEMKKANHVEPKSAIQSHGVEPIVTKVVFGKIANANLKLPTSPQGKINFNLPKY